MIPVTVIGGYLGAGKTTLVNHLLRDPRGERLAVIVNDFGSVNIDAELIESVDGETVQLTNGCVCCSLASGLAEVLFELRDGGRALDRVVVEASGVADPVATAQYAHLPGFVLDAVIVLADATSVRRMANDRYVSRQVTRQLTDADLVILNKTDLIDDERESALREWLQRIAPSVPVVAAVQAAVDRAVLLGDVRPHRAGSGADRDPPQHDPTANHDTASHDTASHESWSFTTTSGVSADVVAAVVESLPDSVVRVKGIVADVDEPGRARVVQRVGRRTTWADAPLSVVEPGSRLVVIGLPRCGDDPAVMAALAALADLFASHDPEVCT